MEHKIDKIASLKQQIKQLDNRIDMLIKKIRELREEEEDANAYYKEHIEALKEVGEKNLNQYNNFDTYRMEYTIKINSLHDRIAKFQKDIENMESKRDGIAEQIESMYLNNVESEENNG